jgi:hypothetical protein
MLLLTWDTGSWLGLIATAYSFWASKHHQVLCRCHKQTFACVVVKTVVFWQQIFHDSSFVEMLLDARTRFLVLLQQLPLVHVHL